MDFVLVDKNLKALIENEHIQQKSLNLLEYVQPSSIDIPLGKVAYNVKAAVNTLNTTVEATLKNNVIETLDLTKGAILRRNNTYLVPTISLDLPDNIFGKTSPKSSIGRIDVFVRSLVDHLGFYDVLNNACKSILWLEITPQSFSIRVEEGIPLTQLQLFTTNKQKKNLAQPRLINSNNKYPFVEPLQDVLSIHIGTDLDTGYVAKQTNGVIDLNSRNIPIEDFFEPIKNVKDGQLLLEKDRFYILRTHEKIAIEKEFSGEMLPYSNIFGELRAHYAGYFDPGFGVTKEGKSLGNYGVLEIRPHENFLVKNKQPVCLMKYLYNIETPNEIYGHAGNNYTQQTTVRLAKFFCS